MRSERLAKTRSMDFLASVVDFAKNAAGTKASISTDAEARFNASLSNYRHLRAVFDVLEKHSSSDSWLQNALICYQLNFLFCRDRDNLKKWLQYGAYQMRIRSIQNFIKSINAAWVKASLKETKGRVVIKLPDAASLSNGQRDLLYFGCKLLRTRETLSNKPCILMIDEIFDYLDDANIVVAQYFLSNIIESFKEEGRQIYICLLTHLDPAYFKGYALRKTQIIYLDKNSQRITETMRKLIAERDNPIWKSEISKYFLHYHPDECDISDIFNSTFGLPKRHGTNVGFRAFLVTSGISV